MCKRVVIATILGFIAGILCYLGMKTSGSVELSLAINLSTIFNRAVIGFLIGVSAWKMNWVLHGIVMGFIGGCPLWLASAQGGASVLVLMLIASIVWGFLIELFTSKIFKAPQESPAAA